MDDRFPKEKLPVLYVRRNSGRYWIRKHLTVLTKKNKERNICFIPEHVFVFI